jgi:hypothetical protein
MIQIGFHNVAELIFQNNLVKSSLPKYKHLFDSWELAQKIPQMRSLGIRSILDFINTITDKDIEAISEIFKFPIEIMKMELGSYKNVIGNIEDFELQLPLNINVNDMCLYRKGDKISVLITTG